MKTLPQLDFLAGAPRPWGGIAAGGLAAVLLAGVASWRIEQDNRQALARLNEQAARLLPPAPRKAQGSGARAPHAGRARGRRIAPLGRPARHLRGTRARATSACSSSSPMPRPAWCASPAGHAMPSHFFAYLHELEADARLVRVALTTQQLERETPGQPLRFVIQAGWRGAGGAEGGVVTARPEAHVAAACVAGRAPCHGLAAPLGWPAWVALLLLVCRRAAAVAAARLLQRDALAGWARRRARQRPAPRLRRRRARAAVRRRHPFGAPVGATWSGWSRPAAAWAWSAPTIRSAPPPQRADARRGRRCR